MQTNAVLGLANTLKIMVGKSLPPELEADPCYKKYFFSFYEVN